MRIASQKANFIITPAPEKKMQLNVGGLLVDIKFGDIDAWWSPRYQELENKPSFPIFVREVLMNRSDSVHAYPIQINSGKLQYDYDTKRLKLDELDIIFFGPNLLYHPSAIQSALGFNFLKKKLRQVH